MEREGLFNCGLGMRSDAEEIIKFDTTAIDMKYLGVEGGGCIFCGQPYSREKFNKIAHAIPHFLGNNALFNHNECDNCNFIFSDHERNLSSFMGMSRSLYKIEGKKGVPAKRIKNGDDFYKIDNVSFVNITAVAVDNHNVCIDKDNLSTSIKVEKDSYYRHSAYKALSKIALSIMPIERLKYYGILRQYVIQDRSEPYPKVLEFDFPQIMFGYYYNIHSVTPKEKGVIVSLYDVDIEIDNGDEIKKCHSVVLSFYYGHSMIQMIIPDDYLFYSFFYQCCGAEKVKLKACWPEPSLLNESIKENFNLKKLDFSISDKIVGEMDCQEFSCREMIVIDSSLLRLKSNGRLEGKSALIALTHLICKLKAKREAYIIKNDECLSYSFNIHLFS